MKYTSILEQPWLILTITTLILFVARGFLERYRSLVVKTGTPPHVRYFLPWIGSAIEMGKDPDAFFQRVSFQLGPIFKIKTLGQDTTYVTSPELISAVYRDVKAFEFLPIRLWMSENIFGISHAATYSPFMADVFIPMHHRGLSPKNVGGLHERYGQYAREAVLKAVDKFDGKTMPLVPFLIPPAFHSAAYAFLGREFDTERAYQPFRTFDNQFHFMVMGTPKFMLSGAHRAWDELINVFEEYLTNAHEDISEFMRDLEMSARDHNISTQDIAKIIGSDFWAVQANAVNAAYWTIALEIQKPHGLSELVAEVDGARMDWKARHPDQPLDAKRPQWVIDAPLPLLMSAIQEALRISTSTFSIRQVSQPVEFAGYHFETGERIACVTRAVHFDEEIHTNPREYNSRRYLEGQMKFTKNGKAVPNHSMPFGGGVSMCEGRHFAMGELKIFLALMLTYATIEKDPTSTSRPKHLMARMGVGVMPPVGDMDIIIGKRNVPI